MAKNMDQRKVAIVVHSRRPEATQAAVAFVEGITGQNITCYRLGNSSSQLYEALPNVKTITADQLTGDFELIVVFGGDGTILAAAEAAVPNGIPLLGVNLGHVGFLAELDPSDIPQLIAQVVRCDYQIENRLTLQVDVKNAQGEQIWSSFAVNEVSLEKFAREKMLDLSIQVDKRPLYRFGADGLLLSTPTGSTAYAFSLGGPVVWPNVAAFLLVPMAAHALFARPLVLSPDSVVDLDISTDLSDEFVLWCDGRRTIQVDHAVQVQVKRHSSPLLVARLSEQPFTSRLVKRFDLNVEGFRRKN